MKLDGRKARWFDCRWNTKEDVCCEKCKVCKYLDFLDFAESVGKPPGSVIEYNKELDEYLKLESVDKKQEFIASYLLNRR